MWPLGCFASLAMTGTELARLFLGVGLAAILGDEEGCRTRLLRAKEAGTLPKPDHLKSDLSLESVRENPWFKKLLGE
jgi:hypothetical protein